MLDMNSSYLHVLNRICEDVQQKMGSKLKEDNEIEWTVDVEVLFFYAMIGHKPVGVNRHFMMLLIHNKFSAYINHQISSKVLWNHLDSMYDMAALHECEIIPFPNEEKDFELPEDCYDLLRTKHGVTLKKSNSEGDVNKNNSNSAKALKKVTPKLKQSSTPVSTPKNNFATPAVSKPLKTPTVVKNETKINSSESTPKVKQESGSSSKANKIRRSSSPFSTKLVKSEPVSSSKEDSPDVTKKSSKSERGGSPAVTKKTPKPDPSSSGSSSKKTPKSESSSSNGSKPVKVETPDSSTKKVKADKEVSSKKGKAGSPAEVHTKKVKADANGVKKKSEAESNSKKTSESNSVTKPLKPEAKSSSSKGQDVDTPTPSGSRKSSPVVKVKSSDNSSSNSSSNKKLKRPRVEEPSKKSTPTPKRRRL